MSRGRAGQIVYFIKSGSFVKIGRTGDVKVRLQALRTHNPHELTVLATVKNTEEVPYSRPRAHLEAVLQDMFEDLHHSGEWYRYEGRLVEFVGAIRGAGVRLGNGRTIKHEQIESTTSPGSVMVWEPIGGAV